MTRRALSLPLGGMTKKKRGEKRREKGLRVKVQRPSRLFVFRFLTFSRFNCSLSTPPSAKRKPYGSSPALVLAPAPRPRRPLSLRSDETTLTSPERGEKTPNAFIRSSFVRRSIERALLLSWTKRLKLVSRPLLHPPTTTNPTLAFPPPQMGESGAMKPSSSSSAGGVSSKKDTLAPFVILMTAYLSLNSVLNLSNKYALVSRSRRVLFRLFLHLQGLGRERERGTRASWGRKEIPRG